VSFDLPDLPARLPRNGRVFAWRAPSRGDVGSFLALLAAYTAACLIGLHWTVANGIGAVFWPAAGVGLAGLLLGGVRLWPAIFIGRLAAAFILASAQPWWGDVIIAGGAVLGAMIPALIIVSRPGFNPMFARLSDLVLIAVAGALGGGFISGLAGFAALALTGVGPGELAVIFVTWVLGFAVGVLTLAPLILAWSPAVAWREPPRSWLHFGLFVATVCVVVGLVFLRPQQFIGGWHLYPLLIWAALAFNARGSSVFLVILTAGAIVGAKLGVGPLSEGGEAQRLLQTQQYLVVSSVCTLVLAAVADERRGTRKLQAATEANLREIAQRGVVEEQLRLVINELNHRVKNSLATVQSLASQTLRSASTPQEAREKLVARIVALAAAHDVLTRERWRSADIRDLVKEGLAPFARPLSLHLEGPSVRLEPGQALAMAMALHELATNATKYGALGAADGRLAVTWRLSGQGDNTRIIVQWLERGGPAVRPPASRGFGSRLLVDALPRQLRGSVKLEFARAGLSCEIQAAHAGQPPNPSAMDALL
jgi:two-component sensor histidine kinase